MKKTEEDVEDQSLNVYSVVLLPSSLIFLTTYSHARIYASDESRSNEMLCFCNTSYIQAKIQNKGSSLLTLSPRIPYMSLARFIRPLCVSSSLTS